MELPNQYDTQCERHGLWAAYYPNGTPMWKDYYHHGQLHGPEEGYWVNGDLMWRRHYRLGKIYGLNESYEQWTDTRKKIYHLNIK
jgi:antitoxin component YwqK of YwqJK toxin-antitoxin module